MSLLVVVSGSRGMQVVFQHPGYPQPQGQTPHEQEAATTPLSEGADKRVGGDEGPRTTSEPVDRVHGLQASAVAGLLCPSKSVLVERQGPYVVTIDGSWFLTLPCALHTSKSFYQASDITHFSLVLHFTQKLPKEVVNAYCEMLVKLRAALLREQIRCNFLLEELHILAHLVDVANDWHEAVSLAFLKSELARELKVFIECIIKGEAVQLTINYWLLLCFRIPDQCACICANVQQPRGSRLERRLLHRLHSRTRTPFHSNASINSGSQDGRRTYGSLGWGSSITMPHEPIPPHMGILLEEGTEALIKELPSSTEVVRRIIGEFTPFRTLAQTADTNDLGAELVSGIASHLHHWGLVRTIYPLQDYSLFRVKKGALDGLLAKQQDPQHVTGELTDQNSLSESESSSSPMVVDRLAPITRADLSFALHSSISQPISPQPVSPEDGSSSPVQMSGHHRE